MQCANNVFKPDMYYPSTDAERIRCGRFNIIISIKRQRLLFKLYTSFHCSSCNIHGIVLILFYYNRDDIVASVIHMLYTCEYKCVHTYESTVYAVCLFINLTMFFFYCIFRSKSNSRIHAV